MGIIEELMQQNRASMTEIAPKRGIVLAKVTNIQDPDKKNRVRCQEITTDTDIAETNWAWVMSFMAGKDSGAVFYPNVGDLVLLAYLDGDAHNPVVLGSVWSDENTAPYSYDGEKNDIRSIKTPAGSEILIDDTSGKEKISITTKAGSTVVLDDGEKSIALKDKNGDNALTLNLQTGEITLKAKSKLTLQAGSTASITLDGNSGAVTVNGQSKLELKSTQINAEAQAQCALKANGQMSVESSGITQVKGSMVKIN